MRHTFERNTLSGSIWVQYNAQLDLIVPRLCITFSPSKFSASVRERQGYLHVDAYYLRFGTIQLADLPFRIAYWGTLCPVDY
jgi:hypothetical protein